MKWINAIRYSKDSLVQMLLIFVIGCIQTIIFAAVFMALVLAAGWLMS